MIYLVLGLVVLGAALLGARWFVATAPADLARALRTFAAVFSALASTGLIFSGRFGLAVITIAATVMAVRSLRGPGRFGPAASRGPSSSVETTLLAMQLDHATGELDGVVRTGPRAGSTLSDLGVADLLALLEEARLEDPPSVALLETYLDRRDAAWRTRTEAGLGAAAGPAMDEQTALEILGLERGASADAVKAAHRRLMAKLHPDHGGSGFLAAQINRARDYLLGRRR